MCLFPPPGPGKPIASRRSPTCRRARLVYILYYVHLCVVVSYHYRVVPLHTTTKGRLITLLFIYYFRCRRVSLHRVPPLSPYRDGWCECVRPCSLRRLRRRRCATLTRGRVHSHTHARTHSFETSIRRLPPRSAAPAI